MYKYTIDDVEVGDVVWHKWLHDGASSQSPIESVIVAKGVDDSFSGGGWVRLENLSGKRSVKVSTSWIDKVKEKKQ